MRMKRIKIDDNKNVLFGMVDLISRQDAIEAVSSMFAPTPVQKHMIEDCLEIIENLPSVQPDSICVAKVTLTDEQIKEAFEKAKIDEQPTIAPAKNRLQHAIDGKTEEETYNFLSWLMFDYAKQYTDSRSAVIQWLMGSGAEQI